MKNILICLLLSVSNAIFGQNYFPTTGPVCIGTGTNIAVCADLQIHSTANYLRLVIQSTSAYNRNMKEYNKQKQQSEEKRKSNIEIVQN